MVGYAMCVRQSVEDRVPPVTGEGARSVRREKGGAGCRRVWRRLPVCLAQRRDGVIPVTKEAPGQLLDPGLPKNRSYLLSHLVGQYHRRW